jgi:hypothetical protein
VAASQEDLASLDKVRAQWQKVKAERLAAVNSLLQKYQQTGLSGGGQ